jgi:hypothetical protein
MKAGHDCADQTLPNDEWIEIIVELHTEYGNATYKKVQDQTQALKDQINSDQLSYIPYVTLDGKHSLRTANDLLQSVCDSYTVSELI